VSYLSHRADRQSESVFGLIAVLLILLEAIYLWLALEANDVLFS
jgi:hypothetical protein